MKKINLLLLFISTLLMSCSSDDDNSTELVEMRIDHYPETMLISPIPSNETTPYLGLRYQEGDNIGTNKWENFIFIEGFDYEPGFIYSLSVNKTTLANPPADASSVNYSLRSISSKEEVGAEVNFKMDLKIDDFSFITNDSGLQLLNQIDVNCNELCDDLDSHLNSQTDVKGIFRHAGDQTVELLEIEL
ncbi:DUF4377 domain-containing protein [Psychroflexus montanilacus]|uniref:DUF4377 domain-containing protein n=1 Tax=Psychroflexus montanilacus TaxID=2873598 RepID=UPI001CCF3D5E|nr:DUF4377 domain-containing protein [Psychroflexus montanilacus]MBZ9650736.1 DUF4377 domain-containing protein [Psychroflexus montanilacus]